MAQRQSGCCWGRCVGVCWIAVTLLLTVVTVLTPASEGVAVVALHEYRAYLMAWQKKAGGSAGVSLCGLVQLLTTQIELNATVMHISANNVTLVTVGLRDYGMNMTVKVNNNEQSVGTFLEGRAWTPVCVGVRQQPANDTPVRPTAPTTASHHAYVYQAWVSVSGHVTTLGEVEVSSNATVLWGYHLGSQLYDYHSFNGFVAAVSRSASLNDPALLPSSCLAMVRVAEDMKSLESWRRFGNIFLEEMDDTVVCEEEELDVTLTGPMDYENFDRRCRGLGGRLLTQDERDQGRDMEAGQLQEEEKMDQNSDINETGLVKKEEVDQGKQLYTYLFSGDSADLNSTARCTALVGDSVTELPCVTDLHSTLCRVPASLLYTLFGDIEGFDHHYTLKLVPEGFFFEGRDGLSNISEVDGAWVLWSSLHHRRWNLMHSWPMGRRQWRSPRPAMITPLTLSSCNSLEFSSNDGLCYLSYFRCDGLLQITDGSDEESCHVPFFIPSDDQRSFNPFPEFSRSEVEYTMDIINIGKMTSLEDMAVMEILFDFSWHDFRLNFVFHNELDNIFPCMHAWTPHVLVFAGSPAGQMIHSKSTSSKCYVRWHNEGETLRHHRNLTDPYMSRQPEKNAKIWIRKKERLHLASPCNLRLDAFPFGQYQCKVMFELGTDEQMKWVQKTALGDDYQLHYSGKLDLYDYMLDKITVSTRVHRLTLTLYISGQPAHHVLNSFAPSAFMFLISYSTFYFPLTDFNERIMASLTSLLVLVSLSAQSSGNYVRTPYLKAIDLWFVLLIIYCFLVIICNVVVNALLVRENEMKPILVMKISPSGFQGERKRRCRFGCISSLAFNAMSRVMLSLLFIATLIGYFIRALGLLNLNLNF